MTIKAEVIKDSISTTGMRITTLKLTYPRFIHSEFLTHRMFSRNSSSSRAVPIHKLIDMVEHDPVIPSHWGKNQKGMQAEHEVDMFTKEKAVIIWLNACKSAVHYAKQLDELNIHKQVVNRLLEPFSHIQTVVTATEWENFFKLRLHKDAQPEIQQLAKAMKEALDSSDPDLLRKGEWHLPFIYKGLDELSFYSFEECLAISVARCARVSYFLRDGQLSTVDKDIELCKRLSSSDPKHLSPFEHVAVNMEDDQRYANFRGWKQLRAFVESGEFSFLH
jgi:thymidylate synthase ThyX